jgi:hypothetical protein
MQEEEEVMMDAASGTAGKRFEAAQKKHIVDKFDAKRKFEKKAATKSAAQIKETKAARRPAAGGGGGFAAFPEEEEMQM